MAKLIMMRGLPASGKSTRAKEIVKQGGWVRVNRDLLRTMLHFDKFTGRNEGLTVDAEKAITLSLLKANTNVVVDDCNLGDNNKDMWKNVAVEAEASFEVESVDVPVSTCRFRDADRDKKVGSDVITNMALRYGLHPKPEKGYVLCDLDGTLANIKHRLMYAKGNTKDWGKFFAGISEDTLRDDVADVVADYAQQGYDIIFVTARPEDYKKQTLVWLIKNMESRLPNGFLTLIMRRENDKRPDTEVKQQILDLFFPDRSLIEVVIDDRPSVIRMWEGNGLKVKDVGEGIDF